MRWVLGGREGAPRSPQGGDGSGAGAAASTRLAGLDLKAYRYLDQPFLASHP
jgi:hypothetical protein